MKILSSAAERFYQMHRLCAQRNRKQIVLALLFFLLLFFEVADSSHGINNNYLQGLRRAGLVLVRKSGAVKPVYLTSDYAQFYLLPVSHPVGTASAILRDYDGFSPKIKSKLYLHLQVLLI